MSDDKKIQELVEEAAKRRDAALDDHDDHGAPIEDAGSRALSESLKSSFLIIRVIVAILALGFLRTLIFTVPSQETAVVLRFGKPVMHGDSIMLEPGAHFRLPYPIDEIVRIPQQEVQTVHSSVGWYQTHAVLEATNQEPPAMPYLDPANEGYALTSDTNIIHVRATLKYRVDYPEKFQFRFKDAPQMVQHALDNALIHSAARFTVDDALRLDVKGFEEAVFKRVGELVDEQGLGITLEPSTVQSIPPRWVNEAFLQTQSAAQERSTHISEAQGFADELVATSKGDAAAIVSMGRAEKLRLVSAFQSDAQFYSDLLPEYRKHPEFFKNRLRLETMSRVMTNVYEKWIFDSSEGKSRELELMLSREPLKPKARQQ
jgi:membrane protease subunit HflK